MSSPKVSDRISIVRWREPSERPATGAKVLWFSHIGLPHLGTFDDVFWEGGASYRAQDVAAWADLPAPSDATSADIRIAVRALDELASSDRLDDAGAERVAQAAARLRALIPNAETDRQEEA